jgi:hypothetical protein
MGKVTGLLMTLFYWLSGGAPCPYESCINISTDNGSGIEVCKWNLSPLYFCVYSGLVSLTARKVITFMRFMSLVGTSLVFMVSLRMSLVS